MDKHVKFIKYFIFAYMFMIGNCYYQMHFYQSRLNHIIEGDAKSEAHYSFAYLKRIQLANFVVYVFTLIQILQGVILAVFRLNEPVYFSMIKLEMNSWLGDLDEESAKLIGE